MVEKILEFVPIVAALLGTFSSMYACIVMTKIRRQERVRRRAKRLEKEFKIDTLELFNLIISDSRSKERTEDSTAENKSKYDIA